MTLIMSTRTEVIDTGHACSCHDPDGRRTVRVRRIPMFGAVTLAWINIATGDRRSCAPLETESNA